MKSVSPKNIKVACRILDDLFERRPELAACREDIMAAFEAIRKCFENGRTLYVCGNGGSYADALHICGEFMKSFERKRPLPAAHRRALAKHPLGQGLADELEAGFRAVPLGLNGSLSSAIWNDKAQGTIHFAQELYILGNRGDVLLAISTSGNARNVLRAMAVARALGITTISMTGEKGGQAAQHADVAMRLPGGSTWSVQEAHQACYHALCLAIEAAFFPELRGSAK